MSWSSRALNVIFSLVTEVGSETGTSLTSKAREPAIKAKKNNNCNLIVGKIVPGN